MPLAGSAIRMIMKTKKAITKRFRVTKTGKVLRRITGQDHLRAKKSGNVKRAKKKWVGLSKGERKIVKKLIKKHG